MSNFNSIPKGYIAGMDRSSEGNKLVTHLYKGDFSDPGFPMCKRGWNRDNGSDYSIWRGNISEKGICDICMRRAEQGKEGIEG